MLSVARGWPAKLGSKWTGSALQTLALALWAAGCGAPQGRVSSETQTQEPEAEFRIGIVHVQQVLAMSAPGKDAQRQLERDVNDMNERMNTMRGEVEAAAAAVDEARERRAPRRRLEALALAYQDVVQRGQQLEGELRAEYEQRQKSATGPVIASLREVAARLGEQEGLSMILDGTAAPYFGDQTDLTERIIAELDEAAAQAAIAAELGDEAPEEVSGEETDPAGSQSLQLLAP